MTIGKYAVLDDSGKVLNVILVDDAMAVEFWPGYGDALVRVGEHIEPEVVPGTGKPETFKGIIDIAVTDGFSQGDVIDTKTGVVTPKPVEAAAAEAEVQP